MSSQQGHGSDLCSLLSLRPALHHRSDRRKKQDTIQHAPSLAPEGYRRVKGLTIGCSREQAHSWSVAALVHALPWTE